MAQSGPNSGGDLSDMAVKGTTIPSDSAKPNYIKSVPRPGQATNSSDDLGSASIATAADNAIDIPRGPADKRTNDIITGTGNTLPGAVETKRLHEGANNPLAKGHDRYDKHSRGPSEFEEGVGAEGGIPGVKPAPGEEDEGLSRTRDTKEDLVDQRTSGGDLKSGKAEVDVTAAANNLI